MSDKSRIEQNNTDINTLKGLLDSSASVVESLPNSSICDVAPEDIVYGKKAIGLTGNVTGTLEIINTDGTLYGTGMRFDAPSGKAMSSINVSLDSETIDNLLPENIKSGITLCGITGDYGGGSEGDTGYHVWEFASQSDMDNAFNNGVILADGDYGYVYQNVARINSWYDYMIGSGNINEFNFIQFPETIPANEWSYQSDFYFNPQGIPFRSPGAPFNISDGFIGIDLYNR